MLNTTKNLMENFRWGGGGLLLENDSQKSKFTIYESFIIRQKDSHVG